MADNFIQQEITKQIAKEKTTSNAWLNINEYQLPDHEELKLNIKLTLADLANASAEVACLKYENDQLKKEIERLSRTLEYMADECDALLSSSQKGDV